MKVKINAPYIVHELIDGEVIIVNLKKGDYYSLMNVAADIWEAIDKGGALAQIVSQLSHSYEGDLSTIREGVQQFIKELIEEDIVTELTVPDAETTQEISFEPSNPNELTTDKKLFEIPKLNKYTDMEDLLALDPIHEVDETGWPNIKVETGF